MTELRKIEITSPLESNGAIPVNLQDQTSPTIILRMNELLNSVVLVGAYSVGDHILTFEPGHGFVIGNYVCLQDWDSVNEIPRFYQAAVLSLVGDIVTFDRPLDYPFDGGSLTLGCANRTNANMGAIVGTPVSPVIFRIKPLFGQWDITRIMFQIVDAGAMDDGLFGSQTALPNGLVFRTKNGYYYNRFNIKNNGDWGLVAFDGLYSAKAPAGLNAFRSRLTFGGQNKVGAVIRLDSQLNDEFQLLIGDTIAQTSVQVMVEGHVVTD